MAALKASFAECDAAWDATTEANALSMIAGRGQRSRLSSLIAMTIIHNNEEYGYGALYLRLKVWCRPPATAVAWAAAKSSLLQRNPLTAAVCTAPVSPRMPPR